MLENNNDRKKVSSFLKVFIIYKSYLVNSSPKKDNPEKETTVEKESIRHLSNALQFAKLKSI